MRREVHITSSNRIQKGQVVKPHELVTIHSERIRIPDSRQLVHLQFRRFAGCPVCDLHLHSFARRNKGIAAASIQEFVVFHSTAQDLSPHVGDLPFSIIPDLQKKLYAEFGVESSPRALLDPRIWGPVLWGAVSRAKQIAHRKVLRLVTRKQNRTVTRTARARGVAVSA